MKAMIFAAGVGSRLRHLTKNCPKALVKIHNQTLLEILIRKLKNSGFNEIIINVHHFSEMIKQFLIENNNFGCNIEISDESDFLLDTGGGLKKASFFFNDNKPFMVHNVDILSDIDLSEMYQFHERNSALATIAVKERKSSRMLLFNKEDYLCAWENTNTGEMIKSVNLTGYENRVAFSGIHVISPELFNFVTETGAFSIINLYLRLAQNFPIKAYHHNQNKWFDLGKPENITEAEQTFHFL